MRIGLTIILFVLSLKTEMQHKIVQIANQLYKILDINPLPIKICELFYTKMALIAIPNFFSGFKLNPHLR